ncbi:MAG: PASTA domain-containing protein, partial [Cytophagales bacterium]|nr:PASTA domain-containing protein [Cytophagales bacterium]
TAQKIVDGKYSKQNYYTSFVGYFPADQPRYSCMVVIDNPKGYNQYGADVAAPVFKEIADKIYSQDIVMHNPMPLSYVERGVFPVIKAGHKDDLIHLCEELGLKHLETVNDETARWVKTKLAQGAVAWNTNKVRHGQVPDVRGLTLKDALYLLENAGLSVHWNGKGKVESQSQYPGTKALKGSRIVIELS